jgi:hypothetical protein
MRIHVALCLLTLGPITVAAQDAAGITLSVGMATAYGGVGPSGSVRLEVPLHQLSETVALVWGGTGWLAQTDVAGSRNGIKRNSKGIGPLLGMQWRPGSSEWRVTLGGGVECLRNDNQNPTLVPCVRPPEECGSPGPLHSRRGADRAGFGAVVASRLTLPPQAGATIEFGAVGTRHALFDDGAWWGRFEVGFRFGFGGARWEAESRPGVPFLAVQRVGLSAPESLDMRSRILAVPPERRRVPRWVVGGAIGGAIGAGLMLALVSAFDSADHANASYLTGAGIGAFGGFVLGALIAGE